MHLLVELVNKGVSVLSLYLLSISSLALRWFGLSIRHCERMAISPSRPMVWIRGYEEKKEEI